MSSLLNLVLDAHGGTRRWDMMADLVTAISMQGHLCPPPAPANAIPTSRAFFSLREQRIVLLAEDDSRRIVVEPHFVSLLNDRDRQLRVFPIPDSTAWTACIDGNLDLVRTAYVLGFVARHYIAAPFLFTEPGVMTEEEEPWHERGEVWRVLRVEFPPGIEAPARVQHAYYGPDGLLRRTRYRIGDSYRAEYVDDVSEYQEINGIWLPLLHEVAQCDEDSQKFPFTRLAKIRLSDPFFSE